MTARFEIAGPYIPDLVALHGRWQPDDLAFVDHQASRTWRDASANVNRIANGLIALGVGKGDRVSIMMGNCIEYAEIIYGVMKAGGCVVPLNLAVSEAGLVAMNVDADAVVAFYTPDQFARMAPHFQDMSSIRHHIVFGGMALAGGTDYAAWLAGQSSADPGVTLCDEDPCNIIYSSGTTGRPKGIKHIHGRRIRALYEMALMHRYHYGARSLCSIGLYSNIAWAPLLLSLLVGGPCVIQKAFQPEEWVDLVAKHRITHTMAAPILFQRVLAAKNFSREAVSSLEAMVSGGSPLFEGLKRQIAEEIGCAVIELYGLTEGFITSLQPEESEGRLASVGKPVRGNDYILLDDDDNELGWGATGEICAHSIHMMTEYHNRPDATQEALYVDAKGKTWLRTGDIGTIDDQGYLFITDRKKDMILSGGQNVYPADIEAVMITHPDVSEVAVIGVEDAKWGETPIALIVPASPDADAAAICAWTNDNVGKRQRIREVIIRPDMPRNPNGKILKRQLRDELGGKGSGVGSGL